MSRLFRLADPFTCFNYWSRSSLFQSADGMFMLHICPHHANVLRPAENHTKLVKSSTSTFSFNPDSLIIVPLLKCRGPYMTGLGCCLLLAFGCLLPALLL